LESISVSSSSSISTSEHKSPGLPHWLPILNSVLLLIGFLFLWRMIRHNTKTKLSFQDGQQPQEGWDNNVYEISCIENESRF
jgi:hypothetical protein